VVPAQVCDGRVGEIDPRGLFGAASTPGGRRVHAARLVRLPRLLARYAARLEPEAPESGAPLDDRSLRDFGRLYFGDSVAERWMTLFVGPAVDCADTSRVLFLRRFQARAEAHQGLPRATLGELALAAAERLGVETGVEAQAVERLAGGGLRVRALERGRERLVDADAVVVATGAPEAARVADTLLARAERDAFARVRFAPRLVLVLGLRRALHPHPQHISVPAGEGGPLCAIVLEPGVAGGRVPAGQGLAYLEATPALSRAADGTADAALAEPMQEAFERLLPGARGAASFRRLYRLPRAAPRFDVGRYREIASFERVQALERRDGRRLYFAGDYLMDPSWNGALVSGQRAARALHADLATP
jgi:protoporphyrinogen oxidase